MRISKINTCVTAIMVYYMCMDIVKLLREEIKKSKESRYRIAKETGVSQTRLCRLMQGESINAENAGRLLEHFGYTLKKQKG